MSLTRETLTPVTTAAGLYPALHTLISQSDNMSRESRYAQSRLDSVCSSCGKIIAPKMDRIKWQISSVEEDGKRRNRCSSCLKLANGKPLPNCEFFDKHYSMYRRRSKFKFCGRECYYKALRTGLINRKFNTLKLSQNAKNQWNEMREYMSQRVREGRQKQIKADPIKATEIARQNGYKGWLKLNALNFKPKSHIIIETELKKYNITPIAEYFVPKVPCFIDEAFPENKIAIFCDGEYWHNYPDGTKKDARQTSRLQDLGWKVLRFWDKEIKQSTEDCIQKILAVL